MKISTRAQNMPESPIRKLAKYADAAKRNGVHIYHLNIGQPDIKTPACAMDALQNFHEEILEYSPSQGIKSLRTKMVGYYAEYGIDLSPDEIIITTGGSEAIMFAYMACLNPGDEIIVTDPSYANYMAFAISCGAVVKSVKYQFSTLIDMQNAYIALCTYGKDLGYGLPNDGVFMSKEDNRWYVLINCSDLPLVLFAAHCHHGELLGWIDYFIPMPPMQLHVAKSFDIATYQADSAPIRVKKQIANLQLFAQKQMSFPKFKQILGNVEKGRIWDHVK